MSFNIIDLLDTIICKHIKNKKVINISKAIYAVNIKINVEIFDKSTDQLVK